MVHVATPRPSIGAALGQALGTVGANQYNQYRQQQQQQQQQSQLSNALQQGMQIWNSDMPEQQKILGLHQVLSGMNPAVAKVVVDQLQESQKRTQALEVNKNIIRDLEQKRGLPEGSLSAYASDPKMAEQVTRPAKMTQASQPINPEQLERIKNVRAQSGFEDLDELGQYRAFIDAGVSKENAEAESKLKGQQLTRQQAAVENAYKAQKDFIDETTSKHSAFETEMKPRLMQMQHMKPEDLVSPTAAKFLELLDIPLGSLDDPSSELYQKLSQDLLKGLPETYGNRILKVEVENFLKTIPTLLNSPNGRRMIASNMLKLGEMKEVYYNEMRRQQKQFRDANKPLPPDFQQEIFDYVKPQINRINQEFVKMSEVKDVPEGTIPFFDPNGNIVFVPEQDAQWAQTEGGGKRIW